ncbi:MAG: hypothetical protein HY434_02500 [Candidatus Liptonbacteria bacterium]|nr:hypothetical protein [Candidatus Liptonbacteria bacterium]
MIIFLYGPDEYRREQKKKSIIAEFKKKRSNLGVGFFDLQEKDALADLKEFMRAQSVFGAMKLAVVEGVFGGGSESGLAKELEAAMNDKKTTILLSEKDKPTKRAGFLLSRPVRRGSPQAVVSQSFDYLTGSEWNAYIEKEAGRLGVEVDTSALGVLALVYQNNTWGLITELEKLSNFGKSKITKSDLEAMSIEVLPDYWAVMSGLRSSNVAYRLSSLAKLFAQNEPGAKVFNILASQWRSGDARREREKVSRMAEYDAMVKSGRMEYEESLLDLTLSQDPR